MGERLPAVLVSAEVEAVAVEVIASLAGNRISDEGLPSEPWALGPQRLVQRRHVDTTDLTSQAEAVRLADRGVGLVIVIDEGARVARLRAALRRSVRVHDWRCRPITAMGAEHLQLLHAIARGATASAAAARTNVSLRTAHRRLGEARTVCGVPTTAGAAILVANACAAWVPRPADRWVAAGTGPSATWQCPEASSPWSTGSGPERGPRSADWAIHHAPSLGLPRVPERARRS